jgi:hypothetical protein
VGPAPTSPSLRSSWVKDFTELLSLRSKSSTERDPILARRSASSLLVRASEGLLSLRSKASTGPVPSSPRRLTPRSRSGIRRADCRSCASGGVGGRQLGWG